MLLSLAGKGLDKEILELKFISVLSPTDMFSPFVSLVAQPIMHCFERRAITCPPKIFYNKMVSLRNINNIELKIFSVPFSLQWNPVNTTTNGQKKWSL